MKVWRWSVLVYGVFGFEKRKEEVMVGKGDLKRNIEKKGDGGSGRRYGDDDCG